MNKLWMYLAIIAAVGLIANIPHHMNFNVANQNDFLFFYYIHEQIKVSQSYGEFPHWIPYFFSGMPYFANAQSMVFTLSGLMSLFLPVLLSIHLGFIIHTIIAGLGMFFLAKELKLSDPAAIVPAILFMVNGWAIHQISGSGMEKFLVYSIIPWIFVFLYRSLKGRWLKNAVIAGLMGAIAFMGSGFDTFLWTGTMIGLFFLFHLVIKPKRWSRLLLIGGIFAIVLFGLVAIKLLPMVEFGEVTNKKGGFTLEQSFQKKLSIGNAFKMLPIGPIPEVSYTPTIGIAATMLFLLAFLRFRNRNVIFLSLLILFNVLVAMNIGLYGILFRFIPGFNAIHDVTRGLFITVFAASLLAGIGFSVLIKLIKQKKNAWMIALLLVAIFAVEGIPREKAQAVFDIKAAHEQNELLNYIKAQPGIFRIHNIGTNAIG
ncbi:MAG: hypothetical protein ABIH34_01430, partial [Nanoarchaeota archaeon]